MGVLVGTTWQIQLILLCMAAMMSQPPGVSMLSVPKLFFVNFVKLLTQKIDHKCIIICISCIDGTTGNIDTPGD